MGMADEERGVDSAQDDTVSLKVEKAPTVTLSIDAIQCPTCGKNCKGLAGYVGHARIKHKHDRDSAMALLNQTLTLTGQKEVPVKGEKQAKGGIVTMDVVGAEFVDLKEKTRLRGELRRTLNLTRKLSREDKEDLLPEIESAKEYLRDLSLRKVAMTLEHFQEIQADYEDNIKPAVEDYIEIHKEEKKEKKASLEDADDDELKDLKRQEKSLAVEEEKELLRLKLEKRKMALQKEIDELKRPPRKHDDPEQEKSKPGNMKMKQSPEGDITFEFGGGMDPMAMFMMMNQQQMAQSMRRTNEGKSQDAMSPKEMLDYMEKRIEVASTKPAKSEAEIALEKEKLELEFKTRELERSLLDKRLKDMEQNLNRPSDLEYYAHLKNKMREAGMEGINYEDAKIKMDMDKSSTALGALIAQLQAMNNKTDKGFTLLASMIEKKQRDAMRDEFPPVEGGEYEVEEPPPERSRRRGRKEEETKDAP